jgi:hypothetical protein
MGEDQSEWTLEHKSRRLRKDMRESDQTLRGGVLVVAVEGHCDKKIWKVGGWK